MMMLVQWLGQLEFLSSHPSPNGCRLYSFQEGGKVVPKPVGLHERLSPDSSTPVVVHGRVYGCRKRFYCLDVKEHLKPVWEKRDMSLE